MDDVFLSLNETVSPWRGEALGHHQRERGVGVHAHIATLDVWADAGRHVTLEGFREVGQGGQTTEESWERGEVKWGGGVSMDSRVAHTFTHLGCGRLW